MAASTTSLEEAAYIASEYIYSIDNLPMEVTHILQEIKHRDVKAQELQTEIDKDSARYIRYSLRQPTSASPISGEASLKSTLIPSKIAAAYEEIQALAGEKQELAQKLIELMQRTRTKLDIELNKVRVLQGEPVETYASLSTPIKVVPAFSPSSESFKNPVSAVTESLRNALATPVSDARGAQSPQAAASPTPSSAGANSHKRRKVTATTPSIKVPARSASPTVQAVASQSAHQRSRLSRQIHPPVVEDDEDMDAEGDDDVDGEGDDGDGDDRLYCYCQKQSYGDMIACDNEGECPYEWFHLSCTNIKGPTPDRWYCDYCKEKITDSRRKRKK
ncbi:hypothetical protein FA15DRAFT_674959 [Coprinopsis marcescibilis]|uniref:Chromatin modification-related protein n=1 Tax=Coprinopsis marcescibilis TaxID=230819 RepID=A0A5C3KFP1_COPMA|nr:hypothetical protein FA15DRAFT_674959 [Coprinopsis marcescibilis]